MVQSVLRRSKHSRLFETRLVRALQQVQTANALAQLFAGDEVWFEIHFAGGVSLAVLIADPTYLQQAPLCLLPGAVID